MVTAEQKERFRELQIQRKSLYKKMDRKKKLVTYVSLGIGVIIGIIMDVFIIFGDKKGTLDINLFMRYFIIAILLMFFLMYPLQIIIHEAGHLIGGLLTGYRFLSFRVFSTVFIKKDGRILKKKFSIKGTAGQCLMYPPELKADGSFPYILYNLGGGLSNLIFSVPFIIPAVRMEHSFARILIWIWVIFGIVLAITNIIPMTYGVQNDGMNLYRMLKNSSMRKIFYLQLKLNAEMSDGKRIQGYAPEVFVLPEDVDDTDMLAMYLQMMGYYQQLALNHMDTAKEMLSKMVEKLDSYKPAIIDLIEMERLFFMVLEHQPIEEIAVLYERLKTVFQINKTDIGIWRVRYVYETLLSEEEKQDIITLINKKLPKKWKTCDHAKLHQDFLKTAKNFPVSGEAEMFTDIVENVLETSIKI